MTARCCVWGALVFCAAPTPEGHSRVQYSIVRTDGGDTAAKGHDCSSPGLRRRERREESTSLLAQSKTGWALGQSKASINRSGSWFVQEVRQSVRMSRERMIISASDYSPTFAHSPTRPLAHSPTPPVQVAPSVARAHLAPTASALSFPNSATLLL